MHGRVKTYRCRRYDGKWFTLLFDKWHAREVGTPLELDGIALDKAITLVKKWNMYGQRSGWQYYIPFVKKSLTS